MTKSGRQVKAIIDALRQEILERYKTPHAFCRANPEVKRSTVYMLLSGKYPGDAAKQTQRIRAALAGREFVPDARPTLTAHEAYTVLQETKCAHCRKLDKRGCPECRTQTAREAQAIEEYLRSREVV